ncbi:hypothetical protein ABIA38_009080 [Embleya sp. AB8]
MFASGAVGAVVTVRERKSLPRSKRTCSGRPPKGPCGSVCAIAERGAAGIEARVGGAGVTSRRAWEGRV